MILKDKIYINTKELGYKVSALCELFTYKNPEIFHKKRLKLSIVGTPPYLYHYSLTDINGEKILQIPRGGLDKVLTFYKEHSIAYRILDQRIELPPINVNLIDTVLQEQQTKIIDIFIKNEGGLIESDPGCISGDTVVLFNRAKNGKLRKISSAYELFHGLRDQYHNWNKNIPTYVRSYDGTYIKNYLIKDIVKSGIKPLYKLILENGKFIKATSDHKIMTNTGWVKLIDLTVNHEVLCDNRRPRKTTKIYKKTRDEYICSGKYHPYAVHKRSRQNNGEIIKHRAIYDAYINSLSLEQFLNIIRNDRVQSSKLSYINPDIYDIHHKDFDHFNNDPTNLIHLFKGEHYKLHKNQSIHNILKSSVYYSKVKSIEFVGEEETYDIVCEDPYHNFSANDIIVHNSGKTIAILGLISTVKQPTLILMHELRLSDQWIGEIKKRLTGDFILGKYDGVIKEDGDIVVGIVNSTYNKFQEDREYFDKFGMVVIDETHHVAAHMYLSVINNISAKYRIGVSGTIERRDKKEILIYDVIGKTLIKIKAPELKHRITDFNYKVVNTNIPMELEQINRWTGKKRENVLDMTKSLTGLVENKDRNNIIISETIDCINQGHFPLVMSSRVKHNEYLYEALTNLGINTVLLIGKTRKKSKWEDIQKNTEIQCIVANERIASEGLDYPRLSALINTCPTSNTGKLEQQLGRIRRILPNKLMPLVVDICDNLVYLTTPAGPNYLLLHMAKVRYRFYEKLRAQYNA